MSRIIFPISTAWPAGGYEYLLDSNLDWGQDLKGLKRYVAENNVSDVVLSYFGSSAPSYFGRDFQDLFSFGIWGEKRHVNSANPSKELLAISVTNLQGLYLSRLGVNTFSWLKEKRPKAVIGNTIYLYDITSDARAHERLAQIYLVSGQVPQAERECARVLALEPGAPAAELMLALNGLGRADKAGPAVKRMEKLLSGGGYDAALEKLKELVNNGHAARAYSGRLAQMGAELFARGSSAHAERLLNTAIMLDKGNMYAYLSLGAGYMKGARYKEAAGVYSAAEGLGQAGAELLYNKALALYYLRDIPGARVYLTKALEKDPSMPQAKKLLSSFR